MVKRFRDFQGYLEPFLIKSDALNVDILTRRLVRHVS